MEFFIGFIIGAIFSGLTFGMICYYIGRNNGEAGANRLAEKNTIDMCDAMVDDLVKKQAI